jgi:hypothetical protein
MNIEKKGKMREGKAEGGKGEVKGSRREVE